MIIFFSAGQHTELIDETLTLDGVAIEQIGLNCETKWFKFLGMRLDDKLSWEGQRAHVYQKAAAETFMLARLKFLVLLGLWGLMVRLTWYGRQFPYPLDGSLSSQTADIVVCSGFMSQISVHHV